MRSFLRSLARRDARHSIGGVLALLVLATVWIRLSDPEIRLRRLLVHLSPAVGVAVIEPAASPSSGERSREMALRARLETMLPGEDPPVPDGVHPVATLVVDGPLGDARVAIIAPREAVRAGLTGVQRDGFVAVGPGADRAFARVIDHTVPSAALRFLRAPGDVRLLVRPSWVARRVPLFSRWRESTAFVALRLEGDPRHARIDGVVADIPPALRTARTLLHDYPPGSFLILDGMPVASLLVEPLPPVLEALRVSTGVGDEIAMLARAVQDGPFALALRWSPALPSAPGDRAGDQNALQVALGVAAPRAVDSARVGALVRSLLEKRLRLTTAVTERIRVDGRTIRHRAVATTPGAENGGKEGALEETAEGMWRILRAARGAGATDLVARLRASQLVLGTAPDLVREVSEQLEWESNARGQPAVAFFADGDLLRRMPAWGLAVRGLSPTLQVWAQALGTLRVHLWRESASLRFSAVGTFHTIAP